MEDVLKYKVEMFSKGMKITLFGERFKELARLVFSDDTGYTASMQEKPGHYILPEKRFSAYVDILRNEKPLDLEIVGDEFVLRTTHESVGENERRA
jgi:hypothetical protein